LVEVLKGALSPFSISALPQVNGCGNVPDMPTTTTPLRVIGYVRVSTAEQAASGYGLTAQEDTLRAAAERNGWELIAIVRDEGASGKDLDRPGLREALAMAHKADAIAVAKLDRLTRSIVGLSDLMEWGQRNGLALVALDLGLDTSTTTGRLVARVMASVGEWEREQISERTRAAATVRRTQGKRMGRPGVRDSMPEVCARIKAARDEGLTWQAIADALNADGVATVRGGSGWRVSSVQSAAGYVRPPGRVKRVELPDAPRVRRGSRVGARDGT
jgi:DNA invertase Pin-like site-specific DNA recombinase